MVLRLRAVGILAALLLQGAVASAVSAYTGGPDRADILGFDPREQKLFYTMLTSAEVGDLGRYFYIQFDSSGASPAVEARPLGPVHGEYEHPDPEMRKTYSNLRRRLVPLQAAESYDLRIRVKASEHGTDPNWSQPKFILRVDLESDDLRSSLEMDGYCRTVVTASGLYGIPGRRERVAIVTYVGHAYGCEGIDVPVVLTSGSNPTRYRPPQYVPRTSRTP